MDDWVREYRHELDEEGVDPDALLAETDRNAEENRRTALQLLERYLDEVARLGLGRDPAMIRTDGSAVFPRFLDLAYPSIERGEGVWLTTTDGRRILDACSGGAMVACLGHGVPEIAAAAAEQAEQISYFYNHHFTSEPQERLADRLLEVHARDGAGAVRLRRVRGERDGAAARAAVPRRTRRHRPLARDLAGAGLPRLHDGDARADRPPGGPGAVHAVPRLPPPHPAVDLADRPDRRGRPRRARPPARAGTATRSRRSSANP